MQGKHTDSVYECARCTGPQLVLSAQLMLRPAGQGGSAVFKKSRDFGLDFARVVVGNVVMRWGPPGVRDKRLAGEDAVVVRGWSVRARENRC